MKIVVVIPTYNEAGTVGQVVEELVGKVFPKIKGHEMELLVVDDHSPDGTGKIIREKMKKYRRISLLEGEKQGIGMAYARGFRYAITKMGAGAVMEMDGDFQHDPQDVPRFIAELDKGYDYIIGSRYVPGGAIPKEWTIDRKFFSVVGNLIYQVSLLMFDVHDFTTGFRLARVHGYLDRINFEMVQGSLQSFG